MPTRKQRRRRAKDRRHDWEYVYVDDEGREVEVAEDDTRPARPAKQEPKQPGRARPASRAVPKSGVRKVDPPSWNRVLRRTAIFAPLMLIVIYLLKPEGTSPGRLVIQLVVLLAFFMPFSYFLDGMMYRSYRKRIGDPVPPRERKPRSK